MNELHYENEPVSGEYGQEDDLYCDKWGDEDEYISLF